LENLPRMIDNIFANTLPLQTAKLVNVLHESNPYFLKSFYLSGGTALSLQIGHRESEDLDFFSKDNFDPKKIEQELLKISSLSQTELESGTLNTFMDGVKLQFLEYPYDLIESTINWKGIKLSSIADIACTKLQTISMRGSKKDFIDLYFLLDTYSLDDLFKLVEKKYKQSDYSKTHLLKSLVYFEDAENQPMPRMHKEVSWKNVKQKMIDTSRTFQFV
jgi:predicted nucleotidyltransferase component of viral defense system